MVQRPHVLVVEDDCDTAFFVADLLAEPGYDVEIARNAEMAIPMIEDRSFDLMIMDVMMPGISGLDLCRHVRSASSAPILMISAASGLVDRVLGLELGADDYLTKPFEGRELISRARALLRRVMSREELRSSEQGSVLKFGGWSLDGPKRELRRSDGKLIALSLPELRVLIELAKRPGVVMSREWLVDTAFSAGTSLHNRIVDLTIYRLRAKLDPHSEGRSMIETVRNLGYSIRP